MKHDSHLVTIQERPKLRSPILIAGFDGWPNAGNISTDSLSFLRSAFSVQKLATISPDLFYRYADSRPSARIDEGEITEYSFSPYEFYFTHADGEHDLILFSGNEPEMAWEQFTDLFLSLAAEFSVELLFTIGGTYDYITHNQDPLISGMISHSSMRKSFQELGIKLAQYEGPISVHTVLLLEAKRRDMRCGSIWGHAPQYLQSNNLPVIHQVLDTLRKLGNFNLDLTEMKFKALELQKQINILVQKSPELSRIIEKIENGFHLKQSSPAAETFHDKVIDISGFMRRESHE
ncbi:MAG TPA: PAC2 family protein [Thermodesulfobacteriota bacterium]|nr:PAC2 family protein [Thermodesulfobacteriota bacterium]